MKKLLVISSYPAPYRAAIFERLGKFYETEVFFEFIEDQSRSAQWFVRNPAFRVLNTPENKEAFAKCLHNLQKYDLVLAYDYNNTNAGRLMRACIRKGIPYVINCDGAFIRPHWLKDRVKHYYISHARACFASGHFAEKYFLHYGAKKENIYFHPFTSLEREDILDAPVPEPERRRVRQELGLKDKPTVLFIGQFIPRKGIDVLLEAWAAKKEDAQLVLIGGGDLEAAYRAQIENLGLTDVQVVGFLPKKEVFCYYKASDVFVLPTREDIWGLVINEAMACGLPVISTDRCIAACELIQDNENGFVVKTEDVKALAMALDRLLGDPGLRAKMSENNLKKIRPYTLDQVAQKHRKVIDKL